MEIWRDNKILMGFSGQTNQNTFTEFIDAVIVDTETAETELV